MNFQMFKLDLEKAEELEIKWPTSAGSLKKQESSRKTSAAAAAKSLQSCPTLRDPVDCSPPGSSIHGIFQARVLEWGAIAFSQQEVNLEFPIVVGINLQQQDWLSLSAVRKKEIRNIDAINWAKFFLRALDLKNQLGHWQSRASLGYQGCHSMKFSVLPL